MLPKTESRVSNKCLCAHRHGSMTHRSREAGMAPSPSAGVWRNKMVHTHKGHYSALKRKEILTPDTPWMDLEDPVAREARTGQTLEDPTYLRSQIPSRRGAGAGC